VCCKKARFSIPALQVFATTGYFRPAASAPGIAVSIFRTVGPVV